MLNMLMLRDFRFPSRKAFFAQGKKISVQHLQDASPVLRPALSVFLFRPMRRLLSWASSAVCWVAPPSRGQSTQLPAEL